jgi:ankyrin repeat protein
VKELISERETDFHVANENGTTLLHYASMHGQDDLLVTLLQKGANPNIGI